MPDYAHIDIADPPTREESDQQAQPTFGDMGSILRG